MDMSLEEWISELNVEEYLVDQFPTDQFEEELIQIVTSAEDNNIQQHSPRETQSFCPTSAPNCDIMIISSTFSTTTTTAAAAAAPQLSANSDENEEMMRGMDQATSTLVVPTDSSNGNSSTAPTPTPTPTPSSNCNKVEKAAKIGGRKRPAAPLPYPRRSPLEVQYRVVAERERRRNLNQRFIALSAMLPGLQKMDKASILGDAIKYLKQLEENVKLLEEEINKKSELESVVFGKKSRFSVDDDDDTSSSSDESFRDIEAKISEKNVLIRIHCQKQKGFAVKLLSEIEKLHLTVISTSFIPFGHCLMDIIVVAQIEAKFSTTVSDLVRNLRYAFMKST